MLNFIYLYGTLPVAAAPLVLGTQYGIRPQIVAQASVVSIVFAMPVMCFSSVLFMDPNVSDLEGSVNVTSTVSS